MRTTVINLFAGPGAGKSSLCAGVYAALKWHDIGCEMALEYAKDMVWQGSHEVLRNQLYVFGKQQNRLHRLNGKVDVIVTDSPLLNSVIYDASPTGNDTLAKLVWAEHAKYDGLNFFVERRKRYNPVGRLHTKSEAEDLDTRIEDLLSGSGTKYVAVPGEPETVNVIVNALLMHRPDLHPAT